MKKIEDVDRVEQIFMRCPLEECDRLLEHARLVCRIRCGAVMNAPKPTRGRPTGSKNKPPVQQELNVAAAADFDPRDDYRK